MGNNHSEKKVMDSLRKKDKAKGYRIHLRWTKEEVLLLRRLYRTHSNAEIAETLGRKVSSVVFKGHRLGLSKGVRRLRKMGRENIRRRWESPKAHVVCGGSLRLSETSQAKQAGAPSPGSALASPIAGPGTLGGSFC
jgi:hypothetical protein